MLKNKIRFHYPDIERGCSLSIPISIRNEDDEPIDLTNYTVLFTVKAVMSDFDRYDGFAFIKLTFSPQAPLDGKFNINLSSYDLDLPPGKYYFDIELQHNTTKELVRIVCCDFTLIGGPSNRGVDIGTTGSTILAAEGMNILLLTGKPFIVYTPSLTGAQINDFETRIRALEEKI